MSTAVASAGSGVTLWQARGAAPWHAIASKPIAEIINSHFVPTDRYSLLWAPCETWSGSFVAPREVAPKSKNLSAVVSELKSESGLTAAQLAKILGVTRRSVHNWAAGVPTSAANEVAIRELSNCIFSLPAESPTERRELLLDSSGGESPYRKLVREFTQNERIQYSLPVEELLGL